MTDRVAPIQIDPAELRRLVEAMREGYRAAIPEATSELEHGFVLGWKAAAEAMEAIAKHIDESASA